MKPAAAAAHAVQIKKPEVRSDLDTRANRYDILSRLADDLAHEIKNPLNAIVVNLEVLRRKIETGATREPVVASAQWQALRGSAVASLILWLATTFAGVALINYV